jgi:hypothetical protein
MATFPTPKFTKLIASLLAAAAQVSIPVLLNDNNKTKAAQQLRLMVNRDRDGTTGALVGTLSVWGAALPEDTRPDSSHVWTKNVDPGASTAVTIATGITYAAFSNYNWIVKLSGVMLGYKAAPDAANLFKVTNVGGYATITIGDTTNRPAFGAEVVIYNVTPVEILADGANVFVDTEIIAKSTLWVVTAGAGLPSASLVRVDSRA